MAKHANRHVPSGPLTIQQLEAGLRALDRHDIDHRAFLDQNIVAFRQTVLSALRETTDALDSRMSQRWRVELEDQIVELRHCMEVADRYIATCARESSLN